jgi:hypothetical protein
LNRTKATPGDFAGGVMRISYTPACPGGPPQQRRTLIPHRHRLDGGLTPPGSRSCPAHNKKPDARPGFSLAMAGRSVLRKRRAAEMIVHADANDVVDVQAREPTVISDRAAASSVNPVVDTDAPAIGGDSGLAGLCRERGKPGEPLGNSLGSSCAAPIAISRRLPGYPWALRRRAAESSG